MVWHVRIFLQWDLLKGIWYLLPISWINIGNNLKSFEFGRILNPICVKKSWHNLHDRSSPTKALFERPGCLSGPTLYKISILNLFKFKTKSILSIPHKSLTCHKPNLFRRSCDYIIRWRITFDLQWRASYVTI